MMQVDVIYDEEVDTDKVYRVEERWSFPGNALNVIYGFGNGLFLEMRVVGDSAAALDYFRMLVARGGYIAKAPPGAGEHKLYQPGDECLGESSARPAHVFVDPTPRPERFAITAASA